MNSGNIDRNDTCDRSMLVQSMYAGSSTSCLIEQERARKNRPKPPPPVKPATLKNKIACRNTQSSFPQTSKLDTSVIDKNLPFSNTADSSETVICEEENGDKGKVTYISESIVADSDPREGESESSNLESTARSNSTTTITNNPASLINGEIKKPKMKPPPPPVQSPQRSSQSANDSNKIEAIRKKLNLESIFDTNQGVMQNDLDSNENGSLTAHRFERYLDSWHIPR